VQEIIISRTANKKSKAADQFCRFIFFRWQHLCRPGNCLLGPNAVGIFLLQCFRHFAQHRVIVCAFVMAHGLPVNRFRCGFAIGILLQNFIVQLSSVRPFLLHEGDPGKSEQQLRGKLVLWQITFYAVPFFAVFVQHQGGWRPDGIKAVEPGWIFLDVDSDGHEFLIDEGCELRVSIRFGFQPSACASSGSGAKVDQQGFVLCFGLAQGSIYVFVP